MRIGIDATFIGTEKPTGLAVYTRNVVNELAKLHDDVVLWTADDTGFSLPSERIRPVLREFAFLGQKRFMVRPLWMEFFFPGYLRKMGVDVLYSTVPGGMARCPVPHVVTVHDLTPITFPEDHPRSVQWNYMHRLPTLLKNAAAVIADSEHTKLDIINQYGLNPAHLRVIGLGYDVENFRPLGDQETLDRYGLRRRKYIIAVGSANRRKNLEMLIAALGKVRERLPHRLVLAGPLSPSQQLRLRETARKSGVEERLVFPGYVPYGELPALYVGAELFTYLSLYEGFGLPVLEAMACGTPVLASNTTSIPEVAGDAAVLVDPTDREAIAEALVKIVLHPESKLALSNAGLERVKYFSWQRTAKEVLGVLKSVV